MRQKIPYTRPIVTMMTTNDRADAEEATEIRFRWYWKRYIHNFILSDPWIGVWDVSVSLGSFEMDLSSRVGKSRVYNSIWTFFSVSSAVFFGKQTNKRTNVSHDCAGAAYSQPFKAVVCRMSIKWGTRDTRTILLSLFLVSISSSISMRWHRSIFNFSLSSIHKSKHAAAVSRAVSVCTCMRATRPHIDKLITIALSLLLPDHFFPSASFCFLPFACATREHSPVSLCLCSVLSLFRSAS